MAILLAINNDLSSPLAPETIAGAAKPTRFLIAPTVPKTLHHAGN